MYYEKNTVYSFKVISLAIMFNLGIFHHPTFAKEENIKMTNQYNARLDNPILSVMNKLNQLPLHFPDAISLASGRPADEFCRPEIASEAIEVFTSYAKKNSKTPVNRLLGQYGKTSGIINGILARHLKSDENIQSYANEIITTVGFQEAAALCVMTLFGKNDVLLVPDPIFIGISGIATLYGVDITTFPYQNNLKISDIRKALEDIKTSGKKVRALYVIPDFSNPQGSSLTLEDRQALLKLAKEYNFLILEDNAYSMFRYEGKKVPSIKSLDRDGSVIYLGTFAKTMYPALRVGYIVANQNIKDKNGKVVSLADEMTKVKSFLTVNTPALDQAVLAGVLLENNYSLNAYNEEKRKYYKNNRDVMIQSLANEFKGYKDVSWNTPEGGFFLIVTLPFNFDQRMLEECAEKYKVIVFPESLLSISQNPNNRVRLAFTNVPPGEIKTAISRFASYIKDKINSNKFK